MLLNHKKIYVFKGGYYYEYTTD
ncbi:MAG: hypothetical protein KHZ86_01870 [Firmicutes bacterium]|nr:hypothetical protein [Clostridium sp.]MBS1314890.1 hypothetical protein [Anaerotignum sp.]MBS5031698.1 hypothetical protein [Bacillota bacterium]HAX34860.1 hypothetical protein [Tyzzerella sp.]